MTKTLLQNQSSASEEVKKKEWIRPQLKVLCIEMDNGALNDHVSSEPSVS